MPYYHLNGSLLDVGSTIMPGNWGRIIRNWGPKHNRLMHELALEELRANEFPARPSRLRSAFFLDSLDEAMFFRDVNQMQPYMCIYEVERVDPVAPMFAADWRRVNPDFALNMDSARRYWNGEMQPPDPSGRICRELLTEAPLRIVQLVHN